MARKSESQTRAGRVFELQEEEQGLQLLELVLQLKNQVRSITPSRRISCRRKRITSSRSSKMAESRSRNQTEKNQRSTK
ncbi:hypothetical protein OsI_32399 [Oryza sativa Indica Group]|uniref:Uncharacterized protein n=2 Tax=Oryza TaxID=4527 RepID=A0A0E0QV36_ORYRU|nr:hypothetical protein OsI_32399 [Oryza sativa Indica Group]